MNHDQGVTQEMTRIGQSVHEAARHETETEKMRIRSVEMMRMGPSLYEAA